MPIPRLNIKDKVGGTPRQPVPLRYACLVANWSPQFLLELLSMSLGDEVYASQGFPFLEGHELSNRGELDCPPEEYARLLDLLPKVVELPKEEVESWRLDEHVRRQRQIRAERHVPAAYRCLPANHFVWSDELAATFSEVVDFFYSDRADAARSGEKLRWRPAVLGLDDVLNECPAIPDELCGELQPTPRQQGKHATKRHHAALRQAIRDTKIQWPKVSYLECARKVSKTEVAAKKPGGKRLEPKSIYRIWHTKVES
jgi:hypothetical protein